MNLTDSNIFFEKNNRRDKNQSTTTPSKRVVSRHSEVAVFIETTNSGFEFLPSSNLLEALIDSGHEIDYQCRGGYCGACRTIVLTGEVEYDEMPLAHTNHDEILPCCCRVKTSLKLKIELRRIDHGNKQGELFDEL